MARGHIVKLLTALAAIGVALGGYSAKADEPLLMFNPYIGGGIGFHQTTYQSGGVVDFVPVPPGGAPFLNFGRERDNDWNANISAGLTDLVTIGPVSIRLQADAYRMKSERIRTDGFPGPPGPSAFQYTTRIDQTFGTNFSLWADLRPFEETPVIMSLGAGAGLANMRIFVTDNQAQPFFGTANKTQLTFMVGAQVGYEINDAITAGLEARFIDFGEFQINTFRSSDNTPTGRYNLDIESRQVMGYVRINLNELENLF